MPITIFSEVEQGVILEHNARGKGFSLSNFPLVQRNFNSGWPLFQVSLFTPSVSEGDVPVKYEPALGGGDCHFFYIGAFNFASLLSKIPGKMEVLGNGTPRSKDDLRIDRVEQFLGSFSIFHKTLQLCIVSANSRGYGQLLTIEKSPFDDASDLATALSEELFEFALRPVGYGLLIADIADYDDSRYDSNGFTEDEINEAIDKDVAVFSGGQIFIDMGEFFDRKVKNEEIKDFFSGVFQVDEFNVLKKGSEAFESTATQPLSSVTHFAVGEAGVSTHAGREDVPSVDVIATPVTTVSTVASSEAVTNRCGFFPPKEGARDGAHERAGTEEHARVEEAAQARKCCIVM